jgi:hypothetical protein
VLRDTGTSLLLAVRLVILVVIRVPSATSGQRLIPSVAVAGFR